MEEAKQMSGARKIVYGGLSIALCMAGTFLLLPGPNGAFVHCGSAALYLVGIVFGRWYGAIGGGLGSMLFDLMVGMSAYTPFSLVIKGVSGYLVGYFGTPQESQAPGRGRILIATLIASAWTLIGYLVAWYSVLDSWSAALANTPFSLMTSGVGIVAAVLIGPQLYRLFHR